jgi:acetyl-CoA carboxylase carboxyl transferase subunit alpha
MQKNYMDFEESLRLLDENIEKEVEQDKKNSLISARELLREEIFDNLKAIDILKIARHRNRPYSKDYIENLLDTNSEFFINGDRHLANDEAIISVFGTIDGTKVLIIGEEKGKTINEKKKCNFGMPHPEGYRKAMRAASLAEKFNIPIVTLVDTPGAFPGIEAEERGQSEAIAQSIYFFSGLTVPIISIVIGEGGSGGALAISVANKLAILKNSVFSVISPEGCAAILWNDSSKVKEAIENLKMTSVDLLEQGIVDDIIAEPKFGAHNDYDTTFDNVRSYILSNLEKYKKLSRSEIHEEKYDKMLSYGNKFHE